MYMYMHMCMHNLSVPIHLNLPTILQPKLVSITVLCSFYIDSL